MIVHNVIVIERYDSVVDGGKSLVSSQSRLVIIDLSYNGPIISIMDFSQVPISDDVLHTLKTTFQHDGVSV